MPTRVEKIKARTTTLAKLPDCDLCKVLEPHKPPSKATFDSPLEGGPWGYTCLRHFNMFGLAPATRLREARD